MHEVLEVVKHGSLSPMSSQQPGLPPAWHQMQAEALLPVLRKLLRQAGASGVGAADLTEIMAHLDPTGDGAVTIEPRRDSRDRHAQTQPREAAHSRCPAA